MAWWRFARGVALARTGKTDEASAERAALARASAAVPQEALFGGTGLESASNILALATLVLDARIEWARGSQAAAIRLWRNAVAAADKVAYDEPPIWFYPVRESLGAALVLGGNNEEAERVFRDDLASHPRNARSLFGLHESLVRQGKTADAEWVKRASTRPETGRHHADVGKALVPPFVSAAPAAHDQAPDRHDQRQPEYQPRQRLRSFPSIVRPMNRAARTSTTRASDDRRELWRARRGEGRTAGSRQPRRIGAINALSAICAAVLQSMCARMTIR